MTHRFCAEQLCVVRMRNEDWPELSVGVKDFPGRQKSVWSDGRTDGDAQHPKRRHLQRWGGQLAFMQVLVFLTQFNRIQDRFK